MDGIDEMSLSYFIRAHEINEKDKEGLLAILDFNRGPNRILTLDQYRFYKEKLNSLEENSDTLD
ncbi:hypothetical protein HNQ88_004951 [Aureibacter tunicatorum]|uniref:Uncharacterized protein n=1 Tax=Aureibacter tunicatorum TaxID=866807 RepID=A0AAE3XUD9_9BACT|nr:hypothetical protein [Aureibacter tunicatorum]BDD07111.1 hypothetical protein AUTU_45940 [Aureibacter tunicatorum]